MGNESVSRSMNNTPQGVISRLQSIESLLAGLGKLKIFANTPAGARALNVIGTSLGAGEDEATAVVPEFSGIVTYKDGGVTKQGIQKGTIIAGNKTWAMDCYEINPRVAGKFSVFITVPVTANNADQVLLPGLQTSSKPSWGRVNGNPPDIQIPEYPGVTGKMVIMIGQVEVAGGTITFLPSRQGPLVVRHLVGTLTLF